MPCNMVVQCHHSTRFIYNVAVYFNLLLSYKQSIHLQKYNQIQLHIKPPPPQMSGQCYLISLLMKILWHFTQINYAVKAPWQN